jgi:hypothetical protein
MTFGPGDRQRRFGWIIWRLHDGRTILPLEPPSDQLGEE